MIHAAALSPDQGWFIEHECFGAVFSKDLLGLDWKQAQCRDYVIDFLRGRLPYGSVGDRRSGLHDSNGVHEARNWVHAVLALSVVMLGRQADSSEILLLGAVGLRGLSKILGWCESACNYVPFGGMSGRAWGCSCPIKGMQPATISKN